FTTFRREILSLLAFAWIVGEVENPAITVVDRRKQTTYLRAINAADTELAPTHEFAQICLKQDVQQISQRATSACRNAKHPASSAVGSIGSYHIVSPHGVLYPIHAFAHCGRYTRLVLFKRKQFCRETQLAATLVSRCPQDWLNLILGAASCRDRT